MTTIVGWALLIVGCSFIAISFKQPMLLPAGLAVIIGVVVVIRGMTGRARPRWGYRLLIGALNRKGVEKSFWLVSVDGEKRPELQSLEEIGHTLRKYPASEVLINCVEANGERQHEAAWVHVYNDSS